MTTLKSAQADLLKKVNKNESKPTKQLARNLRNLKDEAKETVRIAKGLNWKQAFKAFKHNL